MPDDQPPPVPRPVAPRRGSDAGPPILSRQELRAQSKAGGSRTWWYVLGGARAWWSSGCSSPPSPPGARPTTRPSRRSPSTTTPPGGPCPLTGAPAAGRHRSRPTGPRHQDRQLSRRPAVLRAQPGRHRLRGARRGRHHPTAGRVPVPDRPPGRRRPIGPPARRRDPRPSSPIPSSSTPGASTR